MDAQHLESTGTKALLPYPKLLHLIGTRSRTPFSPEYRAYRNMCSRHRVTPVTGITVTHRQIKELATLFYAMHPYLENHPIPTLLIAKWAEHAGIIMPEAHDEIRRMWRTAC
jgi:hypothetical protein